MTVIKIEKLNEQLFFINNYCVDAKRNTISLNGNAQAIEPKVMQLLLVLVAHNGNVVSQEYLFEKVWPHSVFSPGSIRRAIAILRKALGTEGAKNVITTIPKIGYELNGEISFNRESKISIKAIYLVSSILFCLLLLFAYIANLPESERKTVVTQVQPITASSALEFNAKLSPNNEYIAFLKNENKDDQPRNLWVKDLTSFTEKSVNVAHASEFAWLQNNQLIAMTKQLDDKIYLQEVNLITADVKTLITLSDAVQPASSLQPGIDGLLYVLGLSSDEQNTASGKMVSLWSIDLRTQQVNETLRFDLAFVPYEISINQQKNKLGIVGFNQQGISTIKVFDLASNQFTSNPIPLDNNRYFLSWHPSGKEILLSDGRHLSTVNLNGKWQKLNFESYDFVQHPQYSKNADAIFFSYAKLDIDIVGNDINNEKPSIKLVDSNTVDRSPSISPDGKRLAFISHRKGYPQVYILDLKTQSLMLAYENRQQWLGVSPPVWGGNNRLAFSNYDFPILVTLENNTPRIHQIKQPLGVVTDLYQDDALLIYSSKLKQHIKVDAETETVLHSYPNLKSNLKLGIGNDLCFVAQQYFRCLNQEDTTDVFHFSGQILGWHKSGGQFLFTVKASQGNELILLDSLTYQLIERITLPASATSIFALHNRQIITEHRNMDKDIIKLILNDSDL